MSFAADTTSEVELTCATPPLNGEISKVIKGMSEVQCEEWCKYLEWCSANDAELDMQIERDLRDRRNRLDSGNAGINVLLITASPDTNTKTEPLDFLKSIYTQRGAHNTKQHDLPISTEF